MELEKINELCHKIMSFYDYNLRSIDLYTFDLFKELEEDNIANLLAAKKMIDEKVIKQISNDYKKYPEIFKYCIIYRKELIDNDLLLNLVSNNKMENYFDILCMDRELNDEIVLSILKNIDVDKDFLGKKPFDYRYHILKREEISDSIKEDILSKYRKSELEEIVDNIDLDLQDEFSLNRIFTKEDLKKHKYLYEEYIALNTMKNYLNQKVYKI